MLTNTVANVLVCFWVSKFHNWANPIQVLECNYLSTFYAPGKTNLCNLAICMVRVCMYLPIHLGLYMNIYLKVISYTWLVVCSTFLTISWRKPLYFHFTSVRSRLLNTAKKILERRGILTSSSFIKIWSLNLYPISYFLAFIWLGFFILNMWENIKFIANFSKW